jgi:methionyl-tRNA synthetase
MDKLRSFLNMERLDWSELGRTDLMLAGHQTNQPELLFEKIEDSSD